MTTIVLTGASGFIGRHLAASLNATGTRVRALTRRPDRRDPAQGAVDWVIGDLGDADVWTRLLEPGCAVVSLAYSNDLPLDEASRRARAMVKACADQGASRLIHCSTISVFGRTGGGRIDESTPCNPTDDYGRKKHAVETAVLDAPAGRCEVAVLRPTAVFGSGGQALRSLASSLASGSGLANFGRASLFGRRRMHLVPVDTVVAALRFLVDARWAIDREVFIVSEDDEPANNFLDVERVLIDALGVRRTWPRLPLPPQVLRFALRALGRSEIDPDCRYVSAKLRARGFLSPVDFQAALRDYARVELAAQVRGTRS